VKELVLARHAESEFNVAERLNGDPSVAVALTERGRAQARALGEESGPVDLAAHSSFGRARETAQLAWPTAPLLELPELGEFTFGSFEGSRWADGFDEWVKTSAPDVGAPGGGESRVEAARRFVRGYRALLARPEARVAAIAHGAPVAYVLLALEGKPPVRKLAAVEQARPFTIAAEDLERALDLIDAWAASPAF
jgi:broad specificity phosphatase PhoE